MPSKKKRKPLSSTLTGKSPGFYPTKTRPPGTYFLGKKPKEGPGLNAPEVQRGATIGGQKYTEAQLRSLGPAAQQIEDQQFGAVQRIAGGLNNQYTRDARGQVNQSLQTANRVGKVGNQTIQTGQRAGRQISNLAPVAQRQANNAATNINRQGNQITQVADQYGNRLTRQATGANREADAAAGRVDRQGNQITQVADQYGNRLTRQATGANREADAAARRIDPLGQQVMRIGDTYMGQIGGVGTMLANQARQGFATSGPTEIEAELYRQGQEELAMGRSLSPEQLREATQSARQGMAARGMATGQAALGAELLNRDRYATQRETERRGFAADANQLREENVMGRRDAAGRMAEAGGRTLDAAGRIGMAGRELAGNLYDTAGRMRLAGTDLGGRLLDSAGQMRMDGREAAGQLYDTAGRMRLAGTDIGGRLLDSAGQMRMDGREAAGRLYDAGGRMRMLGTTTAGDLRGLGAETAMRGQSLGGSLLADSGRLRQTGAGMIADLDPFQRSLQAGLQLGQSSSGMGLDAVGQGYGNMLDLYANTGSFNINRNDSNAKSWINNATAIKTGNMAADSQKQMANITAAATRAAKPSTWDQIIGISRDLLRSDERLKTDIKPLGTAGSVLGLTAYEFRYKGDKKKRKGFMAQDVQKVLPGAVREFNHKDGKRLAIIPKVIGQALAEELAANGIAA